MYIILSESDRERLGAPEKLLVRLLDVTAREQATLQHAFRYHDMVDISDALSALEEVGPDGNKRYRSNPELFLALTWIGLRQAGLFTANGRSEMAAELDGLDIHMNRLIAEADEDELAAAEEEKAAEEGKDSSSTPTRTSTS